jgi:hypothetical protein
MAKKRGVGVVILTQVPKMGGLVAVLQVRGSFNPEKMGPESWPGACQVTAHGSIEEGENLISAMVQGCRKDLGDVVAELIDQPALMQQEVSRVETDRKEMVTFAYLIKDSSWLQDVRLPAGSGGLRLITREQASNIQNLAQFDRQVGVTDTRMFSDEREAVQKTFEKFGG